MGQKYNGKKVHWHIVQWTIANQMIFSSKGILMKWLVRQKIRRKSIEYSINRVRQFVSGLPDFPHGRAELRVFQISRYDTLIHEIVAP